MIEITNELVISLVAGFVLIVFIVGGINCTARRAQSFESCLQATQKPLECGEAIKHL